jgi:mRNA-degrading endonuclease toxin of MazEF toxin-antitoxin module
MAERAGLIEPLRWAVVGPTPALVVSYEPFHRSGLLTVCPIAPAGGRRHVPGDVPIPAGPAGLSADGVIVCSQVRTVPAASVSTELGRLTDPARRRQVRRALAHHLGLDIAAVGDGAEG